MRTTTQGTACSNDTASAPHSVHEIVSAVASVSTTSRFSISFCVVLATMVVLGPISRHTAMMSTLALGGSVSSCEKGTKSNCVSAKQENGIAILEPD